MRTSLVIIGCLLALAVFAATQSQFFSGDLIVAGVVRDPGGTNYIKDAPASGGPYARQGNAWVTAGGITDAPSDSQFYGRVDGAWEDGADWFAEIDHEHVWADITDRPDMTGYSVTGHGHIISDVTGLQGALDSKAATNHTHAISDTSGLQGALDSKAATNHTHSASDITSGELGTGRLGSGTASTNTWLRGRSGGGAEWATLPTLSSDTNGVPEAPIDGIAYARKDGAWVGLDITDVAGVTGFGESFMAAVDEVDALGLLALTGGGAATIDSPAKYAVRANSGGSVSTRHRLNIIGGSGITVSLSDDAVNDESDATVTLGTHGHDWSDITGEPSFVETSRQVATQHSLTGGGNLSSDRTLSLVGDESTPAASKYYGTDGSGSRGYHAIAGSHTHPDLANFVFVTVSAVTNSNQDTTYRSVLGTVKSGYSSTLAGGTLSAGSVVKVEATGVFVGDDAHTPDVELRIGSSLTLHFDVTEPQSTGPTEGTPWNLTAWITVTTAGSSAIVNVNGWMDYADNTGGSSGVYAPSPVSRSKAIVSGTLNTTTGNAVDLVYRGNDTNSDSFSCTHFILQQF